MQEPIRFNRNRPVAARGAPFKRARFWLICLFFLVWACAIGGRLFWLQIVRHKEFVERAQKQQQRTFEVAPRRGVLYDRNLRELAMTVQVDSIYAVPTEIEDKDQQAAARELAQEVKLTEAVARAQRWVKSLWVRTRVPPGYALRRALPLGTARSQGKEIPWARLSRMGSHTSCIPRVQRN